MNLRLSRSHSQIVSPLATRRGVALVITLILLAVISTLAIAFLGLTQRETSSVDSMGRTTDSEVAADSALERAKAEITAVYPIRNQNAATNGPNILGPDMMVSICCQNYDNEPTSPTFRRTLPYDRLLNPDQRLTNRYDSAPPVFVDTNRSGAPRGPLDDRFYLDLNRNGLFEDSGYVRDLEPGPGGIIVTNWRVGDPQWIGVLQNPRRAHGPNNKFIARYAFMVVPTGRNLNLNGVHNDAKTPADPGPGFSGYFRNQGVGTYEINLAGFLADLNSNAWNNAVSPYFYSTNFGTLNSGTAFADAWELLRFRYGGAGSKAALPSLNQMLGPGAPTAIFANNGIDEYLNEPLIGLGIFPGTDNDAPATQAWPGTGNRANYFSLNDLIGGATATPLAGFQSRLRQVSAANTSYDRYTFYRLLAQSGFEDSEEEDAGKINLNFINIAGYKATDLVPWTDPNIPATSGTGRTGRELMFLGIVTNLLQREFPTYVSTNGGINDLLRIPVYVQGSNFAPTLPNQYERLPYYSARIHQIVQQAANIVDAVAGSTNFPSVFRPQFEAVDVGTNFSVYVINYKLMDPSVDANEAASRFIPDAPPAFRRWRDLGVGEKPGLDDCVYGVPFIIAARTGLPNFSAFAVETYAQAVRRLKVYKNANSTTIRQIDQALQIGITNSFKISVRHHYSNAYPRAVQVYLRNSVTNLLTNSFQVGLVPTTGMFSGFIAIIPAGGITNDFFLKPALPSNLVLAHNETNDVAAGVGKTNLWGLAVRNRIAFMMTDGDHIIDAVSMVGTNGSFDFGRELVNSDTAVGSTRPVREIWNPKAYRSSSIGISNHFQICLLDNDATSLTTDWQDFNPLVRNRRDGILSFSNNLANPTQSVVEAPFVAVRRMRQQLIWEANDPLVHYTADDLWYPGNQKTVTKAELQTPVDVYRVNRRLSPWGGKAIQSAAPEELDITLRDQSILAPEDWRFPAHALPSVGWIGRIHRGTPWQTIYLKSEKPGDRNWLIHSGQIRGGRDGISFSPTNDWRLVDVLTTTINPSAVRGRLSINQTNVAAWSAALSGVLGSQVIKDAASLREFQARDLAVEPASVSADREVEKIVEAINIIRNQRANREFTKLSDILSVPELNAASPLIRNPQTEALGFGPARDRQPQVETMIYDSDYERIYEQILGLLKVGEPRFVIYAWGQSLKPARLGVQYNGNNIDLNQPLSGPSIDPDTKLVNNYQVTGEVATRAVVRAVFPERESNNPADAGYFRPDYRRPRLVVESFNIIPLE